MKQCFFCKGNMEEGFTNYMADVDGHFIIIKNVPCHKCTQCGEVSYTGTTLNKIDEIIEKLSTVLTEVAVVEFVA